MCTFYATVYELAESLEYQMNNKKNGMGWWMATF